MEKYTKKCAYRKIGLGLFSIFALIGVSSQDASAVSNEKTITVSSNYDAWYKCSWWGQRPLGTGYVSVTHRIGMASGSSSIITGENINFVYKPDLPFFLDNKDGSWDTPYGAWKDDINTPVSALAGQRVGAKSCGPHTPAVAGYVNWSAQKPSIKLVSSDESIIKCSGMSCSGVGDGTATITAEIDKTQSRMWGYMFFKEAFYGEGAHVKYNIDQCKLTTVHGMNNLTTDVYGCRNSSPSSTYVDDKAILELPTTSLSWEVKVSSAPSNGCFQRTNYPVTFANAITQCKSIGSTWDLVTVNDHWDEAFAFGHDGYVKDVPKTISSSKKCSYDNNWPENSKGVLIDTKNKCVSDVPKSAPFYGICYSSSCNTCAGSIPSGSVMCSGDDTELPSNGTWTKKGVTSASCTAEKCEFFTPVATNHTAICDTPLTLGAGSHFIKVPINAKNQIIELWGAGGGGGGDSSKPATVGGGGGNTIMNGIIAAGGGPGSVSTSKSAIGGVATGGDINMQGGAGQIRSSCTSPGKGGGGANTTNTAGAAPAGSGGSPGGGGGGGYYNADSCAASGGGGGAYSKKTTAIANFQDVYVEVGAGGAGGIGQGSTGNGGRGGDGKAIISFACGESYSCSGEIPTGSKMCPDSDIELLIDGVWSPTEGKDPASCNPGVKCQYYSPNCTCNNDVGFCIGTKYADSCGQLTCDGKKDCRDQNWQEVSPE